MMFNLCLTQILLKKDKESVEMMKPVVGTIELMNGFGNWAMMKNKTIVM